MVQAALRSTHGEQRIDDELSDQHFLRDVVLTQTGMEIAVDPVAWEHYRLLTPTRFAETLQRLARRVDLKRYPKRKRGPKKPRPTQTGRKKSTHISTARLLAKKQLKHATQKPPKTRP